MKNNKKKKQYSFSDYNNTCNNRPRVYFGTLLREKRKGKWGKRKKSERNNMEDISQAH